MRHRLIITICCLGLTACHEGAVYTDLYYVDESGAAYPGSASGDSANGVYRGYFDRRGGEKSLQAHVLDGLVLGFGLDDGSRYSAVVSIHDGDVDGDWQWRDAAGETRAEYTLAGALSPHDQLAAGLFSPYEDAELGLYYSDYDSESPNRVVDLAGVWVMDALGISLSIDHGGWIEGYDSSGCAYFGRARQPDSGHNLFEVSLDVAGCALGDDYAIGIGSLEGAGFGAVLVLPLWLDLADRVENWILERRGY